MKILVVQMYINAGNNKGTTISDLGGGGGHRKLRKKIGGSSPGKKINFEKAFLRAPLTSMLHFCPYSSWAGSEKMKPFCDVILLFCFQPVTPYMDL